jgi:glutathione synthase/RimK-type ligase-like ATP-grasp enzyme
MHSEHHQPEEIYHRLVLLSSQQHTRVIDPPATALAAFDKAQLHSKLIGAGIHVPHTVFVPPEQGADFELSEEDKTALGTPFIIKPSMGYGRRGVVLDAKSTADLVRSRLAWPDGTYLFQRRIVPQTRNGRPMYFRAFYVFGSIWCCWWNCYNHNYRLVTDEGDDAFPRQGLEEIMHRIAALTQMQFFSSEIALTAEEQLVVIDYVNDQCHLLSQSSNADIGVPDTVVTAIADRLVAATLELLRR